MLPPALASRRTAVLVGLGLPALAGCDIDPPRSRPSSGPTPTPPPDHALVGRVVEALDEALATIEAAGVAVPALAGSLAALTTAHTAHRDLLAGVLAEAPAPTTSATAAPRRPRAALATVRRRERDLQREVETACVEASSGDLARVLASIAASTAQHLASIDEAVAR